jgi:hypothetical protein
MLGVRIFVVIVEEMSRMGKGLLNHYEKVVDGKLCFRHSTNGAWRAYTQEQLTRMIIKLKILKGE